MKYTLASALTWLLYKASFLVKYQPELQAISLVLAIMVSCIACLNFSWKIARYIYKTLKDK